MFMKNKGNNWILSLINAVIVRDNLPKKTIYRAFRRSIYNNNTLSLQGLFINEKILRNTVRYIFLSSVNRFDTINDNCKYYSLSRAKKMK